MRCLFAVIMTGALHAAPPALSVGFGEVDVTPVLGTKPVFLAGFGQDRRATKVHDPLMARAVVFSDGTKKIAFVCVDVVGLFHSSAEAVRKQCPGFDYICVSSTHNHHGPDTLGLWGPNPFATGLDDAYLKTVEDGAAKAVKRAEQALTPAAAEIGTASDAALLNDSREPIVKHDVLVALRFADPKTGKTLGLVVQWNCHPEILSSRNPEITSDHVGYTVNALKENHGCPVVYLSGTVGGLMTATHAPLKDAKGQVIPDGSHARAEKYGELLADLAESALKTKQGINLLPFNVKTKSPLLPVVNPIYRLAWQVGKLRRTMYEWPGEPLPEKVVETKNLEKPVAIRTEIGLIHLGDLTIPVIPGEIYPELVLGKVQDPPDPGADFPDAPIEPAIFEGFKTHLMIVGLGNDELGYIIPKRQWDERKPFCYKRTKAPYGEINSLGPDTAPLLCDIFEKMKKN